MLLFSCTTTNSRSVAKLLLFTLIVQQARSGAVAINHNGVHFFNNDLPFGGVNNSGIGKAHGWYGFQAFSNAKGIFRQVLPSALELLMPPYTAFKQRMIDWVLRWL